MDGTGSGARAEESKKAPSRCPLSHVWAGTSEGGRSVRVEGSGNERLSLLKQRVRDLTGTPAPGGLILSRPEIMVQLDDGRVVHVANPFRGSASPMELLARSSDVRRRILSFSSIFDLGSLRCTCKFFRGSLEDEKLWGDLMVEDARNPRKAGGTLRKAARRIFRGIQRETGAALSPGWLSKFSARLQGYHAARRFWKRVSSTISPRVVCSLRRPAPARDLDLVEEALGKPMPIQVRSSLMVFNGQEVEGPRQGIIHGMPLLSAAQMREELRWRPDLKEAGLLPLTAKAGIQQIVCRVSDEKILLLEGHQRLVRGSSYFQFMASKLLPVGQQDGGGAGLTDDGRRGVGVLSEVFTASRLQFPR